MIGIFVALLILSLQIHYGLIPKEVTVASFLSLAYPYLAVIGVALGFHAVRAPWLLDKEKQEAIDTHLAEKEALVAQLETKAITDKKIDELSDCYFEGCSLLAKCLEDEQIKNTNENALKWGKTTADVVAKTLGKPRLIDFLTAEPQSPPVLMVFNSFLAQETAGFLYARLEKLKEYLKGLDTILPPRRAAQVPIAGEYRERMANEQHETSS